MVRPVSPNSTAWPKSRERATCPSSRASRKRFSDAGSFLSSLEVSWSAIRSRLDDGIDYWWPPGNLSPDQADESACSRNWSPPATPPGPVVGRRGPPGPEYLEAQALEQFVDLRLAADDLPGLRAIRDDGAVQPAVLQRFPLVLRRHLDEQLHQL